MLLISDLKIYIFGRKIEKRAKKFMFLQHTCYQSIEFFFLGNYA